VRRSIQDRLRPRRITVASCLPRLVQVPLKPGEDAADEGDVAEVCEGVGDGVTVLEAQQRGGLLELLRR